MKLKKNDDILTNAKYMELVRREKLSLLPIAFQKDINNSMESNKKIIHCSPIQPNYSAKRSPLYLKTPSPQKRRLTLKQIREDLQEFGRTLRSLKF